jgi:hypothetical protein
VKSETQVVKTETLAADVVRVKNVGLDGDRVKPLGVGFFLKFTSALSESDYEGSRTKKRTGGERLATRRGCRITDGRGTVGSRRIRPGGATGVSPVVTFA